MIRKLLNVFKRKAKYVYRSSVTGKYVSEAYAKAYPDITVRERL
jgi:hypothetical protein